MSIKNVPEVQEFNNGDKIWDHTFNTFHAKVYIPKSKLPRDIINFGYSAPYFLIFTDSIFTNENALSYAKTSKLSEIASAYDTSIVFIYPLNEGGWKSAPEGIFEEIIENSKIHQYHKDGYAILNNRFTHTTEGYAIRGAIFRTFLIGNGDGADYIAKYLLKKITGAGLWGPADIAPTVCLLENLSIQPLNKRRDIPIISVGNSKLINETISEKFDNCIFQESLDIPAAFKFMKQFIRWGWDGELSREIDFNEVNFIEEPCVVELKTSPDNQGDYAGSVTHKTGFISYYNKNVFDKGPVPLVLCFHGGGDSAKHIALVSSWWKVAHDHNFLLVCVEDHLNSTATEMMELLEILKTKYRIDEKRIYASGFSMGGCKTWDLYQEYPDVFAAVAPMDATFDVGCNLYGQPSVGLHGCGKINENILVPVFYTGGEETPLPELPFQAEKCRARMEYVLKVNECTANYNIKFEDQNKWENKIWGINGDSVKKIEDKSRNSVLTINYFNSKDGNIYTAFGSISGQGHECRYHTCEQAWFFMSRFQRNKDKIEIHNCQL